jgi:hypothetical protein
MVLYKVETQFSLIVKGQIGYYQHYTGPGSIAPSLYALDVLSVPFVRTLQIPFLAQKHG